MIKKSQKSQITLFILAGLAILLIVGLMLWVIMYMKVEKLPKEISDAIAPQESTAINEYIEACMADIVDEGLIFARKQGGYIYPEDSLKNFNTNATQVIVWYYQGTDISPSQEVLQKQLAKYVDENIEDACFDFSDFKEEVIIKGKPLSEAMISNDHVFIETKVPMQIKERDKLKDLGNLVVSVPTKLGISIIAARNIARHMTTSVGIPNSYLDNLTIDNNVSVDKGNITFVLFPGTKDEFVFGGVLEKLVGGNSAPYFVSVPDVIIARVGQETNITIEAVDPDGDVLTYLTANPFFTIDNFGKVRFIPTASQVGQYAVLFEVYDAMDGNDNVLIQLNIFPDPNAVNNPPVIEIIEDQFAAVNNPFELKLNVVDPDLDDLSYSILYPFPGMKIEGDVFKWTPTTEDDFDIEYVVSDGEDQSTGTFKLKVIADQSPIIDPILDQTISVGQTFTYTVTADDPDGDIFMFFDNTELFDIDEYTGYIEFTPTSKGIEQITIYCTDGLLTDSRKFRLIVT